MSDDTEAVREAARIRDMMLGQLAGCARLFDGVMAAHASAQGSETRRRFQEDAMRLARVSSQLAAALLRFSGETRQRVVVEYAEKPEGRGEGAKK